MPIISWSAHFSLGIQTVDEHHQHLFFLLNRLFDGFANHGTEQDIGLFIDELIDYATYHFATEEQWMREKKYPQLARHEQEHTEFAARIVKISKRYSDNEKHVPLELLSFLHNWLAAHIVQSDANFGRFLQEAGGKSPVSSRNLSVGHGNGARRTAWNE